MGYSAAIQSAIDKYQSGTPSWLSNSSDPSITAAVNQYRAPAISGAAPSGSGWQVPGMNPTTVNGLTYQSNVTPTGQGENWDGSYTPWTETYYYDPNHQDIGDPFKAVNHQTGVTDTRGFQDPTPTSDILTPLMFALGAGAFLPGGFAAGAGEGAGGALSKAALDGTTAFGANSVPGAFSLSGAGGAGLGAGADVGAANGMWDVLPEAVGGNTAPAWSSAAADSQLANVGLAEAGGNPLAGYAGAGGVTGTPIAGSSSFADLLKSGASKLMGSGGSGAGADGWAQYLGPLGNLASGIYGSNQAKSAADAQIASVDRANALAKQMFDKQIELQEPFRQGGVNALNQLQFGLGLAGDKTAQGYGALNKDFSMADYQADPGYAFRQSEGLKALQASAAARGGLMSGKAMKDTLKYSQDLGSQEYGNAFNRFQINRSNKLNPLQSLMGAGQSSANTMGQAAGNYGQQAGQNTIGAGNAAAAGKVGSANAITNGITSGWNMYQNNNLMNRLFPTGA